MTTVYLIKQRHEKITRSGCPKQWGRLTRVAEGSNRTQTTTEDQIHAHLADPKKIGDWATSTLRASWQSLKCMLSEDKIVRKEFHKVKNLMMAINTRKGKKKFISSQKEKAVGNHAKC